MELVLVLVGLGAVMPAVPTAVGRRWDSMRLTSTASSRSIHNNVKRLVIILLLLLLASARASAEA